MARRGRPRPPWYRRLADTVTVLAAGVVVTAAILVVAWRAFVPGEEELRATLSADAAAGGAASSPGRPSGPAAEPPPVPVPALHRDVTPAGVTGGPVVDGPLERVAPSERRVSALAAALEATAARAPPRPRRFDHPIVTEAGRLRVIVDGAPLAITIAGIDAPGFRQTCDDASGETWRCGAAARADLARLVQSRSLACDPEPEPVEGVLTAACAVGRFDLAVWLAARGWAKAAADAPEAVRAAEAEAKAQRLGIWR